MKLIDSESSYGLLLPVLRLSEAPRAPFYPPVGCRKFNLADSDIGDQFPAAKSPESDKLHQFTVWYILSIHQDRLRDASRHDC